MTVTDQLLENNEKYAANFDGPLPLPPSKHIAVLACMDARINVYGVLGLEEGEAHVIRNAGGVVTDDEIRSLAISQRLLGTKEIVLIHHTDCGMLTFTDERVRGRARGRHRRRRRAGPRSRSTTSTRTCAPRSPGSGPARSSRTPTRSAASCSTSAPAG